MLSFMISLDLWSLLHVVVMHDAYVVAKWDDGMVITQINVIM